MVKINKEADRGKGSFGWLRANYSFSFSNYFNKNKMGFESLRVINEDFIAPKAGFPTHGHQNMEILTIVLKGSLGHTDSLGNIKTLTPGRIQRMYAGSGIRHSEFNASDVEELNLLQIWIEPNQENLLPEYEEKEFDISSSEILLASPTGFNQSIKIYQEVEVVLLNLKQDVSWTKNIFKKAYFHVIKGKVLAEKNTLEYGDSVEVINQDLQLKGTEDSVVLGFIFK